jgi:hypothetical protein
MDDTLTRVVHLFNLSNRKPTTMQVTTFHCEATPQTKKPGKFSGWMDRLLKKKLSYRLKRMIFLSSVLGLVENIQHPDNELLGKLNSVLKLAHDKQALKFPIMIHSWIWRRQKDNVISLDGRTVPISDLVQLREGDVNFDKLAEYLFHAAPDWVVYSKLPTVSEDLRKLFAEVSEMKEAKSL